MQPLKLFLRRLGGNWKNAYAIMLSEKAEYNIISTHV